MDKFRWTGDGSRPSLTREFILSDKHAPRLLEVLPSYSLPLPTIDMGGEDEAAMAKQIAAASSEFGFFRVVNHLVPEEVWGSAVEAVRDFFLLPPELKKRIALAGGLSMDRLKLYRYSIKDWEDERDVSMWSEVASQAWHPTRDFTTSLPPQIPPPYREHLGAIAKHMGVLMTRLMMLLSVALGLEEDCIKRRCGHKPLFKCHGNYFPPCPYPELAMGLPIHSDSLAFGVSRTLDNASGLQILKGEQWVEVDQPPNSFIVNVGDQLEVLRNGRYKSVVHRVVTNETRDRVSLTFFWGPGLYEIVSPIVGLVNEQHPRVYKSFLYKDYLIEHDKQAGKTKRVKELFRLHPTA